MLSEIVADVRTWWLRNRGPRLYVVFVLFVIAMALLVIGAAASRTGFGYGPATAAVGSVIGGYLRAHRQGSGHPVTVALLYGAVAVGLWLGIAGLAIVLAPSVQRAPWLVANSLVLILAAFAVLGLSIIVGEPTGRRRLTAIVLVVGAPLAIGGLMLTGIGTITDDWGLRLLGLIGLVAGAVMMTWAGIDGYRTLERRSSTAPPA